MEGFFSKKETESISRPDGKVYSCVSCGLRKGRKTPRMGVSGSFEKGILNICDFPSELEDARGIPYRSKSARLLKKVYSQVGINLDKDCLNTYAVRCTSETSLTPYQIDCCRKNILKLIQKYKPKIIVLFGGATLYSVIGNRWKKELGGITKWRGFQIPDQELQTWVCPTLSPKEVLASKNTVEQLILKQDLNKMSSLINTPLLKYDKPVFIDISADLSPLNDVTNGTISFDYETTGLKPYANGHKIICVSIAYSIDEAYVFMLPKSRKARKPFTDLLQRDTVNKVAQNMKFEDTWTEEKLRVSVKGWKWDTMLATHIIDNRTGITGLKFQTYVQFGIIDYDSEVNPYLKAINPEDSNSLNRIEKLLEKPNGKTLLLDYCGYDSIYEYRLAHLQDNIINKNQPVGSKFTSKVVEAYQLLHEGNLAFGRAERIGLGMDVKYSELKMKKLTRKIEIIEHQIFDSLFYKRWKRSVKSNINLNSDVQLSNYLYGTLKFEPTIFTEKGKGSTNEDALKALNIPELDLIIKRSKTIDLRTKLKGFAREQSDGILHPSFNLNLARTYRSSSNNPNFQSIHKRDKVARKTVRKAIIPRPGHQLLEMDFSGIEVGISACYHQDPNMIKYITDSNSDMHRDMANQIFIIDDWDKSRKDHRMLRGAAKNSFVFPQFYGDYFKNCAINLCKWVGLLQTKWKKGMGIELESGGTISNHLISKGIKEYGTESYTNGKRKRTGFLKHIYDIEQDFWKNRFPVYASWKNDHYETYLKYGYVPLKTGFVCSGIMSRNDVINYPFQGSAFHCLLWCFIEIDKELTKRDFDTKLVGQIHDAVVLDVNPKELVEVYNLVYKISTKDLLKAFDWIIVPLEIEAELCPVDGSWAESEEWKPSDFDFKNILK